MDFNEVIKKRYSCRKYESGKAVEQSKLGAVLKAGLLAPTAKNNQPYHIYVARSEELLAKIDSVCSCRYGAPVVLVVTTEPTQAYIYHDGTTNSAVEDATIVATCMMLAAENEGLNTCWLNAFNPVEVKLLLNIPAPQEVVMMLDVGYAAEDSKPAPKHFERRAIMETVTEL